MTPSKEWLKEHVEAVHYSFFIAMLLYFMLIAITVSIHNARFSGWGERGWQRKGIINHGWQHKSKRGAFLLSQAKEWPAVKQLAASDPRVATALESGVFNYPIYVQCASETIVSVLIEFPATTWIVALVYQVAIALLSGNACMEHHWIHMIMWGLSIAAYGYLTFRVILTRCMIAMGSSSLWPMAWFDRFVSVFVGPGFFGFVPWRPYASVHLALAVQQSWAWFHLQRIAFLVTNENGALYTEAMVSCWISSSRPRASS